MENRFGVKDFFLFLFVFILLAMVVLAMVQFDRQYDQVLTIKTQNDQLASDVARIKRQLADLSSGGVVVSPTTSSGANAGTPGKLDAFTHLLQAEGLPGFARGGWFLDNFATKVGRLTPLVSQDVYSYW